MALTEKPLQKIGYKTPKAAIFKSESHKLHNSFPVKAEQNIYPGQPVVLNTDGTIQAMKASTELYLGIAVNSSLHPAYPALPDAPEVTVMMEGFAIIYGVASAEITAGQYLMPDGTVDAETIIPKFAATASSGTTASQFLALNAGGEGDLIQILVK